MQSKLVVGSPHDPLEHEADRTADRVMQRTCASCTAEDKDDERLRRSAVAPSASTKAAPSLVHEVLRSPGQPLDAGTRGFMESRFNHDFSRVRVYAGATADESARQVNARAYTVGHSIVFGAGHYAPATSTGRRLLAHELAHTVQQENGGGGVVQRSEVDDDPALCETLDDVESEIDERVNAELDKARRHVGEGFEKDPDKVWKFLKRAHRLLGVGSQHKQTFEQWVWNLRGSKGRKPDDLSPTKYRGAETLKPAPTASEMAAVVKVCKICVGSDKFGHFFQDGWDAFHEEGQEKDEHGKDRKIDRERSRKAAHLEGVDEEIGDQGLADTGVFSHADIEANLAGRKFWVKLHRDPLRRFKISEFIRPLWNERENTNSYAAPIASVVWSNLLPGDWGGSAYTNGVGMFAKLSILEAHSGEMGVVGDYIEKTPDGRILDMGLFAGSLHFQRGSVKGATHEASVVSGVWIEGELKLDAGPIRKARLQSRPDSRGESELIGSWEEQSGRGGTWHLEKGRDTPF